MSLPSVLERISYFNNKFENFKDCETESIKLKEDLSVLKKKCKDLERSNANKQSEIFQEDFNKLNKEQKKFNDSYYNLKDELNKFKQKLNELFDSKGLKFLNSDQDIEAITNQLPGKQDISAGQSGKSKKANKKKKNVSMPTEKEEIIESFEKAKINYKTFNESRNRLNSMQDQVSKFGKDFNELQNKIYEPACNDIGEAAPQNPAKRTEIVEKIYAEKDRRKERGRLEVAKEVVAEQRVPLEKPAITGNPRRCAVQIVKDCLSNQGIENPTNRQINDIINDKNFKDGIAFCYQGTEGDRNPTRARLQKKWAARQPKCEEAQQTKNTTPSSNFNKLTNNVETVQASAQR